MQNRQFETFRTIAQACDGLGCQLVISLGKHLDATALPTFAGSPIVVGYAPQLELLQFTAVTHESQEVTAARPHAPSPISF